MAFKYNSNSPKNIIYNGNKLNKLIYNGNTVWTLSNPVYWFNTRTASSGNVTEVTSGYPDEWTMTEHCCDDLNYVAGSAYKKYIYSMNPACNNHTPWFVGTASGSTGGNSIATIYVTQLSSGSEIIANGTSITSTGTYNIDVSKSSMLNLTAKLKGNMFINSIYFHN